MKDKVREREIGTKLNKKKKIREGNAKLYFYTKCILQKIHKKRELKEKEKEKERERENKKKKKNPKNFKL